MNLGRCCFFLAAFKNSVHLLTVTPRISGEFIMFKYIIFLCGNIYQHTKYDNGKFINSYPNILPFDACKTF